MDRDLDDPGLSGPPGDGILFSAATMPTSNIPGIGGAAITNGDTPTMWFDRGGAITMTFGLGGAQGGMVTNDGGARTVLFIGDGVGGGDEDEDEDVILNMDLTGAIARHHMVTHEILVDSDGTLNVTSNLDFTSEGSRFGDGHHRRRHRHRQRQRQRRSPKPRKHRDPGKLR